MRLPAAYGHSSAPHMDARAATKTLGGQWHGNYGLAKCPAHNDKTPSLQISDSSNGERLCSCSSG